MEEKKYLAERLFQIVDLILIKMPEDTIQISFSGSPEKVNKVYKELESQLSNDNIKKNYLNTTSEVEVCISGLYSELKYEVIFEVYTKYYNNEKICISNADTGEYVCYCKFER